MQNERSTQERTVDKTFLSVEGVEGDVGVTKSQRCRTAKIYVLYIHQGCHFVVIIHYWKFEAESSTEDISNTNIPCGIMFSS